MYNGFPTASYYHIKTPGLKTRKTTSSKPNTTAKCTRGNECVAEPGMLTSV